MDRQPADPAVAATRPVVPGATVAPSAPDGPHETTVAGTGTRPATLRLAAVATGVEALASGLLAGVVLGGAFRAGRTLPLGPVLGLGAVFALFAVALAFAAVGLWRNRRRPRAFAAVVHALVVLVGLGFFPGGWRYGVAFVLVGGGGLAVLFARPTSRSLGEGRLPGT